MPRSQKRIAAAKSFPKEAGGEMGSQLRARLEILIARAGSQRAFAKRLRETSCSETDYSPRISEWRRGRNLPKADNLRLIADSFGVSADWLLGRVDEEREWRGDLAARLLLHVVRDYDERSGSKRRRDGLANSVGGKLHERQPTPMPAARGEPMPQAEVGDLLADGRIITNRSAFGLQTLEANPTDFLSRVCDWIAKQADEWEEAHKEAEREAVRRDIARLLENAEELVEAIQDQTFEPTTIATVNATLTRAALDPLNPGLQADVIRLGDIFSAFRQKRDQWRSLEDEVLQVAAAATLEESRKRARRQARKANPK